MEVDDPGEASGKSGGSVESVGEDVQACNICCGGSGDQVVLSAAVVAQVSVADDCNNSTALVVVALGAVGEKAVEWWDGSPRVPNGGYTDSMVFMQSGTDVEDWDAP